MIYIRSLHNFGIKNKYIAVSWWWWWGSPLMDGNIKVYFLSLTFPRHSLMELSPSWEDANCAATQ
jgi:hypothetical protein